MTGDTDTLRRQLRQLKALHDEGLLGDELFDEQRAVLERRLVDLVMAEGDARPVPTAAAPRTTSRPGPRTIAGVAALAVAAAAAYWALGQRSSPSQPSETPAAEAPAASTAHSMSFDQIAGMADSLAARLKEHPEDATSWAMLARSYTVLGRNAEAVAAFERAVALRGDDATLLADQADALAVKNGRRVSGPPLQVVRRALQLDPDNPKALALSGTAAFEQKDYAGAVRDWEHLMRVTPADDRLVQEAAANVAEARALGHLPAPADAPASAAGAGAASVEGTVTLAPALAKRAAPDDTLFVFARPATGARMPLAVLRKQVRDLPLHFRLDDSMAMSPAARLSGATQVVVGARISRSGSATPGPGDLSGQSAPVPVGAGGLTIEISEASPP